MLHWAKKCFLLFAVAIAGCEAFNEPEDGLDAGRRFIEVIQQGNFKAARLLLVNEDDDQMARLKAIENEFRTFSSAQKQELSALPVVIDSINTEMTSTMIYYQDAYHKKPAMLQTVNSSGIWRVNLVRSTLNFEPR